MSSVDYNEWVGKKVVKKSRKPFKSRLNVATVKAVSINPFTNKVAFAFEEDDSFVNCERCTLLENLSL